MGHLFSFALFQQPQLGIDTGLEHEPFATRHGIDSEHLWLLESNEYFCLIVAVGVVCDEVRAERVLFVRCAELKYGNFLLIHAFYLFLFELYLTFSDEADFDSH